MSITPLYKGSTPLTHHSFTVDDGTLFPLTGLDVSKFRMYFTRDCVTTLGTGTFSNLNIPNGTIDYQMSPDDTATAGICVMFPVVQLSNDARPFDPQIIEIKDLHIP